MMLRIFSLAALLALASCSSAPAPARSDDPAVYRPREPIVYPLPR